MAGRDARKLEEVKSKLAQINPACKVRRWAARHGHVLAPIMVYVCSATNDNNLLLCLLAPCTMDGDMQPCSPAARVSPLLATCASRSRAQRTHPRG